MKRTLAALLLTVFAQSTPAGADSRFPAGECKITITPPPKPEPWDLATAESDLNVYRAQYGLRPVTLNAILTQASQAHSDDMAEMENADHKGAANMTEVGIALTYKPRTKYLTYWTMVLATPSGR